MNSDEMVEMYKFTRNLMRRRWEDIVPDDDIEVLGDLNGHPHAQEWELMKKSDNVFVRFFGFLMSKDWVGAMQDSYWAIRLMGIDKLNMWVEALNDPHPQIILTAVHRIENQRGMQC